MVDPLLPTVLAGGAFVVVPFVSGAWALPIALQDEIVFPPQTRAGFVVVGVATLATWTGFVVAPADLSALAVLPRRFLDE